MRIFPSLFFSCSAETEHDAHKEKWASNLSLCPAHSYSLTLLLFRSIALSLSEVINVWQFWNRQTDRQTDRQIDRQIDRQTDRQTDRQRVSQSRRHIDRQTDRQTDKDLNQKYWHWQHVRELCLQALLYPFLSKKIRSPSHVCDMTHSYVTCFILHMCDLSDLQEQHMIHSLSLSHRSKSVFRTWRKNERICDMDSLIHGMQALTSYTMHRVRVCVCVCVSACMCVVRCINRQCKRRYVHWWRVCTSEITLFHGWRDSCKCVMRHSSTRVYPLNTHQRVWFHTKTNTLLRTASQPQDIRHGKEVRSLSSRPKMFIASCLLTTMSSSSAALVGRLLLYWVQIHFMYCLSVCVCIHLAGGIFWSAIISRACERIPCVPCIPCERVEIVLREFNSKLYHLIFHACLPAAAFCLNSVGRNLQLLIDCVFEIQCAHLFVCWFEFVCVDSCVRACISACGVCVRARVFRRRCALKDYLRSLCVYTYLLNLAPGPPIANVR